MENKKVGILIIAIALLLVFIVYSFNKALTDIVTATCSHGPECSMYASIKTQTYVSTGIIAFIILIGIFLIFNKQKPIEIVKIKRIRDKMFENTRLQEKEKNMKMMDGEEKNLYKIILEEQGTIFQSSLVEKSGFNKVKVTRVLDRLEGKQLIERKRRGMTNIVIAK
ncbi:MAG: MarR family transcriptional regulator [archaeon]